jgi:hypothetical protein
MRDTVPEETGGGGDVALVSHLIMVCPPQHPSDENPDARGVRADVHGTVTRSNTAAKK